jgi:hypothetical protein
MGTTTPPQRSKGGCCTPARCDGARVTAVSGTSQASSSSGPRWSPPGAPARAAAPGECGTVGRRPGRRFGDAIVAFSPLSRPRWAPHNPLLQRCRPVTPARPAWRGGRGRIDAFGGSFTLWSFSRRPSKLCLPPPRHASTPPPSFPPAGRAWAPESGMSRYNAPSLSRPAETAAAPAHPSPVTTRRTSAWQWSRRGRPRTGSGATWRSISPPPPPHPPAGAAAGW